MVKHHVPFNFADSKYFAKFLECFGASPISRHTLMRELESAYHETRAAVIKAVQSAKSLSLTTDLCTVQGTKPVLALTGHFIDKNWKIRSYCLAVDVVPGTSGSLVSLAEPILLI